jgi:hypothetical protein
MTDLNPYAPPTPKADAPVPLRGRLQADGSTGVWQEDGLLVFEKAGGKLPDRCVICNARTDYKLKRIFMWHPPGYYVLMFCGWLIYALVIASVRKFATVELGLCDQHQERRRHGLLIAGLGAGGSVLFMLLMISARVPELTVLSILAGCAFSIVGLRMARVAAVSRIDDTHAWLKVGPEFLASLPTSPDEEPPVRVKKKKKKVKKAAKPDPEREAAEDGS